AGSAGMPQSSSFMRPEYVLPMPAKPLMKMLEGASRRANNSPERSARSSKVMREVRLGVPISFWNRLVLAQYRAPTSYTQPGSRAASTAEGDDAGSPVNS